MFNSFKYYDAEYSLGSRYLAVFLVFAHSLPLTLAINIVKFYKRAKSVLSPTILPSAVCEIKNFPIPRPTAAILVCGGADGAGVLAVTGAALVYKASEPPPSARNNRAVLLGSDLPSKETDDLVVGGNE